jgi:RNA polymerase sigma factor (TIGR02999 family)
VRGASTQDVTGLLQAWSQGDPEAAEKLVPLVYDELRRQAARRLRNERRDHTLRPTALVHEAYLRLVGQREVVWKSRTQFYAVAARMMRRVLVDHARQHRAAKRAGSWCRVTLDEGVVAAEPRDLDLVALEEALTGLAALDPEKARMVELRFFGGLSLEDTAEVLGVSSATVTREWRMVRAWLYRRMHGGRDKSTGEAGPS